MTTLYDKGARTLIRGATVITMDRQGDLPQADLLVQGSRTPAYVAPPAAAGTTYWNKHVLDGPMISLEDGVLLAPKIAVQRNETIRLASGMSIAADRYSLSGAFDVDLWYDRADAWAGLAVVVADGSTVHYERL